MVVGFYLMVRSVRVLGSLHRVWLQPAQRCVEETWGFMEESRRMRHRLDDFKRVTVRLQTFPKKHNNEEFKAYGVNLTGADGMPELLLGMYMDLNRALDHAIDAAVATGFELIDQASDEQPKGVSSASLAALAHPRDDSGDLPWWRQPTVIALIAANLNPLCGVLLAGWEMLPIMLLFWAENLIVGLFAVLRFIVAVKEWRARLMLIPFFLLHYGGFCMGHGMIVVGLFGDDVAGPASDPLAILFAQGLWFGLIALLASHGYSFFRNFIGGAEYRRANGLMLMVAPYKRVLVMHVGILLAAIAVDALNAPAGALAVLVIGKIGLDINAHLGERRRYSLVDYDNLSEKTG